MIELAPGTRFGPYLVTRKLGSGGMGAVYAVSGPQGQELALKLLDLSQADEEGIARFQREAESHARVDRHPNVARIHGSGVVGRQPYLVMDLLSGGDLAAKLTEGPLSSEEVRDLGLALADGLAHIHACGVLHRDLKPANVLFDDEGRPRLTDFGLARPVETTSLTQSGVILGTPGYMAPEQASAEEVSPATDVFGLGATLYAALTGRPPFAGASLFATLDLLLREPPPPLPPGVPKGLRVAIERALEKNPEARFPDAGSLREALAREETRGPRRGLIFGALALACLALLGLGAAWATGALDRAPALSAPSPSPRVSPSPNTTLAPAEWERRLTLDDVGGGLDARGVRVVVKWIDEERFVTVADTGHLTIWSPGPGGAALPQRRSLEGVKKLDSAPPAAFIPLPGWLVWGNIRSPLQLVALESEAQPLTLTFSPRAALRRGDAYLLFSEREVAGWSPPATALDWGPQRLEAPVEGWDLKGAARLGLAEVVLAWSVPGAKKSGGTVLERAPIKAKGLGKGRRVLSRDWILRTLFVEGDSVFVGDTIGMLEEYRWDDSGELERVRSFKRSEGVMSRAHDDPVYGIRRGPKGTLVSLASGRRAKLKEAVPGDLLLWSRAGKPLGRTSFPELGLCFGLEISANKRFALVQGKDKVALLPLDPLLTPK